jgi:hypothetical protein
MELELVGNPNECEAPSKWYEASKQTWEIAALPTVPGRRYLLLGGQRRK